MYTFTKPIRRTEFYHMNNACIENESRVNLITSQKTTMYYKKKPDILTALQ